jgi:hypothetical protein
VANGHIRWGISIPIAGKTGVPYGSHRTYYQGSAASFASALTQIGKDHAAGAVPWVSFKPASSWQAAAGGNMDSQVDDFFTKVAALSKPVFVTFGHEPVDVTGKADDSGGATQHLAWNRRMRARAQAKGALKNVCLTQIHMAGCYKKLSNMASWWDDAVYDLAAVDAYQGSGSMSSQWALGAFFAFLKSQGQDRWGLGEWGVQDNPAGSGAKNLTDSYSWLLSAPQGMTCVVADYWNSIGAVVAGTGNWQLTPEQQTAYIDCANRASSVGAGQS